MEETKAGPLRRKASRRAVIGASLATSSVLAAYAALGDPLRIFSGGAAPDASWDEAAALKDDSVRLAHLLRRAGFGASPNEWARYQSLGLDGTLNELVDFSAVDDSAAEQLAAQVPLNNLNNLATWWLTRMANTKRPLQEKLTLFWHGLLTSQFTVVRDPMAMVRQNDLYRTNGFGRFPDLLKAVTRDAAMQVYLDIDGSQRRAPNENYARELMELFALGVGNYTETDIREAARAFTGWTVPRQRRDVALFDLGTPVFRPERFDAGQKTVLGKTGNFTADDIVDIIVQQPASARFIVGRLFAFIAYPEPDEKTLQPFIDVYLKNDMRIGAVVEAILRSDAFYSPRAYRAIVRSPVEYVVAAVKALGAQERIATLGAARLLTNMGQTLFEPPNVAGWPGGATWLNSSTLFARLNFIDQLVAASGQGAGRQGTSQPPMASLGTARQALDYFLPFTLDDNIPDGARQVLLEHTGDPEAPLTPDQLRGLAYLVLASPQFHLS